ncbi:hypothetical protein HMPREF3155_08865 [Corynebacterium sp. HMSC06D04]|uniref:DUF3054 domain-containing protein n=2 Tax=Corynebacterium TaxID=1716 RepID=A0A2A4AJH4_9CORY|nr:MULTISPECIES: DUF3054 domain-containing protein [Corynebacterium]PCC82440.1 DUF3054 domain-containing protein [Corynebacterium accolens]AMO91989.1 hypothetical protein AWU68_1719 [Corynebacterium simulans]KXU17225.1 hypothetical protein WM41_2143 [Corynebacterium simulans]MDK7139279.1 DUF3054 domain-containing protein [Corynebacterium simulans]OFL99439.1 hypothetical protein HMPREF2724_10695 [Corynebacterium sp. HMSC071F07]
MRTAPIIDIIALAIFAVLARIAHGGLSFSSWVDAFWPWTVGALLGWVIILAAKIGGRWKEGLVVWLSAVIGGMALWMLVNGRLPHYSFLIVATTMSALFFFGWRGIAALASRRH